MNVYPSPSLSAIDTKSVHSALKSLVHTTVTQNSSHLYRLALVDAFLTTTQMQANPQTRRYALGCVLADIITERMLYLASVFEVSTHTAHETYQEALSTINLCAKTGSAEFVGWCWMYYRYIRAELCISPTVFSDTSGIDERTLRRYQADALNRLTIFLIEQELQIQ
jgi:hypothetical protein